MTTTVRVTDRTRIRLGELARQTGQQMQQVVEAALDAYEKERFFAELRRSSAALRQDPEAWRAMAEERAQESGALRDGLEKDRPSLEP